MSRNFKVFLAIEGILALSFIQDLVRNPILVTLLIGSFIIMAVANKNNNHDLGKKALYLCIGSLLVGLFTSGVFAAMLIVVLIWWIIFGLDELSYHIQKRN
ncbi:MULTISPECIES: hypothetical protein [Carnobacterium]|jgi:dolichol kinase|uniref:Membrane protein n=2 Tax=Carnobacterium maltaromaticum TaxID=2751 RepID=K8E524_CARML|nr:MULTISPECIES: hypothetical protein [Carnobacterium]AOA02400.1 hypothetical protein BFC23_07775 [Carnobacterium maltaromaticum]KRN60108.1 hypothetical protein IV70_GL001251 [Carnobacterium maltaromaticum DSM 20342]KRN73408.1 hypothetical protein IV76_GL001954 [Carnobacterium maltaromaticum]KRN85404.1 hypothetical protein IV75_GL002902 [Carnobacterium maltaromaticum]MBC9789252.1 hypothetical protein [Carnobacterium maltaromaticum]